MKNLLLSLSLAIALICVSCTENQEKTITVTLIQLNDVYEIAPVNQGKEGGFARLAYLIDSIKLENPNTLVLHAGDFLSPSVIGNLKDDKGSKIKGRQMIEVMNASGIDYVTFGNHEFDIKEKELLARIEESTFKWISSNVYHKIDSSLLLFKPKKNFFKLNPKNLETITRVFFMHRRKMIKRPYSQLFNGNLEVAKKLGIDLNLRPQNLDFNIFYELSKEHELLGN